jgi:hypothetical protein
MECAEDGCARDAAFELHVPWDDNRLVCAAHARSLAHQDGVVADALDTAKDGMPEGAANRGGDE